MNRIILPPRLQIVEPQPKALDPNPSHRAFVEEGCKAIAKILLSQAGRRSLIVPSNAEWIGVNLLERDDGLPLRSD